jgi:hypothetical protein
MQARQRLLHDWTRQVEALGAGVRVTQLRSLAFFSLGLLWAGRLNLLAVAGAVPLGCRLMSTEKRLRRWLANPRVEVPRLWQPMLRSLLARLGDDDLLLVFDPTPFRSQATLLVLSVVVHKRALPLSWRIVPQQQDWPETLETVLPGIVAEVAAVLPAGCVVTVLADRGLVGPTIIDCCQRVGWHVVLRLRSSDGDATRARQQDGTVVAVSSLVTGAAQRLAEPVAIFKGAGWRSGWLTIHWATDQTEPWVLFSTRPGGFARVREYRRRTQVEATYQDWKRRGFDLEQSRISALVRLERVLLVLALGSWWLHGLGQAVIRSGQRRHFDRTDRRDRSLVQLGRAAFLAALDAGRMPPLPFCRHPQGWVYRWAS